MLRCDNLWWIWSSFLSINFTLLILSWFLTSFFSRGTRSRFSTLAMNFVVMAYLSDKVRPILRLKLSCLSNKKNRASLDWIWIFGILILSDLGKLHCASLSNLIWPYLSMKLFLVADTQLYKRLFPSVRPSVGRSMNTLFFYVDAYVLMLLASGTTWNFQKRW